MIKVMQALMAGLVLVVALIVSAPWVLAFPYEARFGETMVRSETPIGEDMAAILADADQRVRASPLATEPPPRDLYLTQGGWRWRVLALQSSSAFGLRRPFTNVIVFNRTDIAANRVTANVAISGRRSLSGVIAHETSHILVAQRIGEVRALLLPKWKSEGLADVVAHESSLSDADAIELRASNARTPALAYYGYRQRVAAELEANGNALDALLD